MEESDSPTCIQRITSRGGRSVAVVFVFTDVTPPAIERFLGAWLTPTAFWLEYSKKNVDLELPRKRCSQATALRLGVAG
jgi:hypothetical protein